MILFLEIQQSNQKDVKVLKSYSKKIQESKAFIYLKNTLKYVKS